MRILALLALIVLLVAAGLQLRNRFAPIDPARWHVAPRMPEAGEGDWPLRNGHRAARVVALPPAEALEAFDRIVAGTPRTARLAGAPADGRVTYVTRTWFWAFRDAVSVAAEPAAGGSRLTIFARSELGGSDWGVNRRRVSDWLDAMPGRPAEPS